MGKKMLIDADVLVYQTAHSTSDKLDWGDGRWSYVGDTNAAVQKFFGFLREIDELYEDYETILCFSCDTKDGFRQNLVDPEYKIQREANAFAKPPHFYEIKNYMMSMQTEFHVEWRHNLEADDLLGLLAGNDDIICTIDKDLKMVPCWHLNLRKFAESPWKQTIGGGYRFFILQALMGDGVDGIKGAKGFGLDTATKWLAKCKPGDSLWERVIQGYEKSLGAGPQKDKKLSADEIRDRRGVAESLALKNARLVYILHEEGDYDFDTEEVTLWSPV